MKHSLWIFAGAALIVLLLAAGCQPGTAEPNDFPPRPTDTPAASPTTAADIPTATPVSPGVTKVPNLKRTPVVEITPQPLGTSGAVEPGLLPLAEAARADLAKRLSISIDPIRVVEAVSVTWPDGSLGCPRPGMMYTQMMVDGARIRLEANGTMYEYHAGGRGVPFLCEKPSKPSSGAVD